MKYAKLDEYDIANGEGVGVVLWLQGCSHKCPGCHNRSTWKWSDGHEFTDDTKLRLMYAISKPYISRLTFSGGDPLYWRNRAEVMQLILDVKNVRPDIKIWLYTGYTYNRLGKMRLGPVDVLVDGPFIEPLKNISLKFRGSTNQRLIDYQKSQEAGKVCLYECKY